MTKRLRDDPEMPENIRDAARKQDADALDEFEQDFARVEIIGGVACCGGCDNPLDDCTCLTGEDEA